MRGRGKTERRFDLFRGSFSVFPFSYLCIGERRRRWRPKGLSHRVRWSRFEFGRKTNRKQKTMGRVAISVTLPDRKNFITKSVHYRTLFGPRRRPVQRMCNVRGQTPLESTTPSQCLRFYKPWDGVLQPMSGRAGRISSKPLARCAVNPSKPSDPPGNRVALQVVA